MLSAEEYVKDAFVRKIEEFGGIITEESAIAIREAEYAVMKEIFKERVLRPINVFVEQLTEGCTPVYPSDANNCLIYLLKRHAATRLLKFQNKTFVQSVLDQLKAAALQFPNEELVVVQEFKSIVDFMKAFRASKLNGISGEEHIVIFPRSAIETWLDYNSFAEQKAVLFEPQGTRTIRWCTSVRIEELVKTSFGDNFVNAVSYDADDLMKNSSVNLIDNHYDVLEPKEQLKFAIFNDPELLEYTTRNDSGCVLCQNVSNLPSNMTMKCSRCCMANYCCAEHQKCHWKRHKAHCNKLNALRLRYLSS